MIQYINFMTSVCCIPQVEKELRKLRITFFRVGMNEVDLKKKLTSKQYNKLNIALKRWNMSLKDPTDNKKKDPQTEQVCAIINNMFGKGTKRPKGGYSVYLAQKMDCKYRILTKPFKIANGSTIQRYIIDTKMKFARGYIAIGKYNQKEIAGFLHYKDVYQFSHQFKLENNQTPGHYHN